MYHVMTRNGHEVEILEQFAKKREAVELALSAEPDNQRVWIERIQSDLTIKRWHTDGSYNYTKERRVR